MILCNLISAYKRVGLPEEGWTPARVIRRQIRRRFKTPEQALDCVRHQGLDADIQDPRTPQLNAGVGGNFAHDRALPWSN